MRQRDYYEELAVERDCLQEEIDRRYNQLTNLLAADSIEEEMKPWAERQLAVVEEAYAVLGDPARRQDYDARRRDLATASTPPSPIQAPATTRQRPQAAAPKAAARPGAGWWKRGPVPMVLGGLVLGVAGLLLIAAATGNWDRVTGLIDRDRSSEGGAQLAAVDKKRVAELEAAIQQDPTNVQALFDLGEIYVAAEDWPMGIYWHGRVLEVNPTNTHSLNDMALANFYLGRYAEARATWDRALELEPSNPILHYSLAFFLLNSPPYDWGQARDHFQKVVDLAPDSDTAQSALSHLKAIDSSLSSATPESGEGEGP